MIFKTKYIQMKNTIIYGLLSAGLIIIAFTVSSFLINSKDKPKSDKGKQNNRYVKTAIPKVKETSSDLNYRGRVISYDQVSLAAEVSGKIMQGDIRFKTGQDFKKNDILLHIYSEDVEASLKSAKSSFLQTLSLILPDLQVDYPNEYEKWNSFFKLVDPLKELPELPNIDSNKEKVFLASNNVLASYYNLQKQEINLKRYTIRAPFNGSFKSVSKEIGAVCSPGAELASLIRSDKLEVIVSVFPKDLQWINNDENVQLKGHQNEIINAEVARVSSHVDENTQSVNVYLQLNQNNKSGLLQGEYVDVSFVGNSISGFEIPREALVDDAFVYQLQAEKLVKTPVTVIRKLDDSYIISGIDSTKEVVIESLTSINQNVIYKSR